MNFGNGSHPPPDIHAILRTLAQSHPGASEPVVAQGAPALALAAEPGNAVNEYDPAQFIPEHKKPAKTPASQDPSTITTWAPALRHVTMLIARDGHIVPHLQKLRRSQADHEKQWWEGRKALTEMQANRGDGRKQIEDILKGVGGSIIPTVEGTTPEDDDAELKRYDAKVYKALNQMHDSMKRELKSMGIPFFCIQPSLVVQSIDATTLEPLNPESTQTTLSPEELKRLQLRMIETLEDLSGV